MDSLEQKIAEALCEIRYRYVEFNNKLYTLINSTVDEHDNLAINNAILPNSARETVISSISLINRLTVDKLTEVLEKFIEHKNNINASRPSPKQRRFSKDVIEGLELAFAGENYPTDDEKLTLAKRFKLTIKQINNWFTNKRNRAKYQKSAHDDSHYY